MQLATLIFIVLSGFLGVFGHWLTRYSQGRTASTFKEYIMGEWAASVQSLLANFVSSISLTQTLPDHPTLQLTCAVAYGAFMAGWGLDSGLNRDDKISVPVDGKIIATKEDVQRLLDDEK